MGEVLYILSYEYMVVYDIVIIKVVSVTFKIFFPPRGISMPAPSLALR